MFSVRQLSNWFAANRLIVSIDKTCYTIFKCIPDEICINHVVKLRGQPILKVDKSKYLGVIIDNELTWKARIDYMYYKLLKFIGIIFIN